jgi:hypothetical protein
MFTEPDLMVRLVDEVAGKLRDAKLTVAGLVGAAHRSAAVAPAGCVPHGGTAIPVGKAAGGSR